MRYANYVIRELSVGGPVSRLWLYHIAIGMFGCGVLSVPSSGTAIALIPLFLMAGGFCLYGAHKRSRRASCTGLGLLIVAAWTRAWVLWGLDQGGAGSKVIASFVWAWIAGAAILLFISTWNRGLV